MKKYKKRKFSKVVSDWVERLVRPLYLAWWSILYKASVTRLARLSGSNSFLSSLKNNEALDNLSLSYALSPVSLEHKAIASENLDLLTRSIDLSMSPVSRRFFSSVFNSSFDCITIRDNELRMVLLRELRDSRRRYREWLNVVKDHSFDDDTLLSLDVLIKIVRG